MTKKAPLRQKPAPVKKKHGRPNDKALRWTLFRAGREFGIPREVLAQKGRGLGIQPGEDDLYSTKQVLAMAFGDKDAEVLKKLAAEAQSAEMKVMREAGELIPTAVALAIVAAMDVRIRQRICASGIPNDEKDEILIDLVKIGEIDWSKEAKNALKRTH